MYPSVFSSSLLLHRISCTGACCCFCYSLH